ncbi:MAG: GAF domain-containing protein [Candidatus Omnitrophica bacterium]|nr:GAF domain-containing protein [Candidatus Omnitrophota bacterium]
MNIIFSISVCSVSLATLSIGIFILFHNKKSLVNRTMFLIDSATFLWLFCYSMMYITTSYSKAMTFMKFGFAGVIFVPVFFYHFLSEFLEIKTKMRALLLHIFYAIGTAFVILLFNTDFIASGLLVFDWGYYPKAGVLLPLYLAFFLSIFNYCVYNLYIYYRTNKSTISDRRLQQVKYLFIAFFITAFTAGDWIPWYNIKYLPLGFITIFIYVIINAYAIVKHQLMGIEVIIKKTLIFAGLFVSAYAIFASFAFLGQVAFEHITGGNRWASLIPSIVIIVLMLRPLENLLTQATDKYLFQKKYDYRELLKTFSTEVLSVLDINRLVNITVDKLSSVIKIESCGVLLLNKAKDRFELVASAGIRGKSTVFGMDSTLVTFLDRTKLFLSIKDQGKDSVLPDKILQDMNKLKLVLAIPLVIHEEMIGILTLGKKKSDEDYTQDDMTILTTLARALSIAINNAEMFDELGKTQAEAAQREKMAVIGTLAAGINHEICNPLGIARGQCEVFLLNARDGLYKNRSQDEQMFEAMRIMEKVIKETDRATAITKKLSSFAKPGKGHSAESVNVAEQVDEVIALIGHDLMLGKIEMVKDIPTDTPTIAADHKQIQEILFNLIRNAAQAIDENGKVTVKTRQKDSKLSIDITDTGHGIPEDKLEQIFNPFYTTKAPGKGTGLGLFIVRQIVQKNKGTITVKSKAGEGTTFMLEFPVAKAVVR